MPIRFRCAYCNQLMAISRRKAGNVVRCPKCAGEIIVPGPEGAPPATQESAPPRVEQGFDDPLFDLPHDHGLSQHPTVKAPTSEAPPASTDSPSMMIQKQRRGVFLPLTGLLVLIGIGLLVLILAFVIGLIVGKSMSAPPDHAQTTLQGVAKGSPLKVAPQRGAIKVAFQRSQSV